MTTSERYGSGEQRSTAKARALARQRALSRLQEMYAAEFWEMYQQEREAAGLRRSTRKPSRAVDGHPVT